MNKNIKKAMSLILLISILSVMIFSLGGCNEKKNKGFECQFIKYELFNEDGELVGDYDSDELIMPHYGLYMYKYNGKPCKLTVDMIEVGTGKRFKNYDQIIIGFYKYNEETNLPEHIKGGGFQNEELEWPTEIGIYDIHIDLNILYETIDGKEYLKYHPAHGHIRIIIEE